ncbi:maleylpyruvate isomerase N-terminal domain-containing protein [Intrasporangium sp.]|uniref:maleylpyruvate isomerase N-terminal domain-containing protein n=1 Tax=Intrasporangium sp. TaxID=1925024 RepID=UPI0033652FE8
MSDLRAAFVEAADHVIAILARDDVSTAWREPSALADWSVGGLVAHFAAQLPTALRLLRAEPGSDPIAVDEHYHRSAWVGAAHEAEVNAGIREGGEREASDGHAAVLAAAVRARAELPAVLAGQPADRAVLIPWAGWSLLRDDFLTGRMLEIVVHGEDVAASVGFTAPRLSRAVLGPVLGLLTRLAMEKHGQGAIVSALTRSERAPRTISAF